VLNRISLRQMEYFVATAECGSIIIASEKIHVSSPSISAAIAHIESELQTQLFIRQHAKGLIPTAVGKNVMLECKHILNQASGLYSLAAEFSGSIRGPLKLGCFPAFAPMVYADIIHGFSNLYKQVSLDLYEDDQQALLSSLIRNDLDVALTYDLNIDEHLIHFESLTKLPPHALVSEEHPLAASPAVTLEELSQYPMILLDMPYSNEYFLSLFRTQNLNPNVVRSSKNIDVVRSMVANNIGYTILNVRPKNNYSLDGKRLIRIRIADEHRPMHIGIATPKNVPTNIVVQAFISRCKSFISDHFIPGMSSAHFYDPHIKTQTHKDSSDV
jgi:DNA-binding transcriptional LysR family regulator